MSQRLEDGFELVSPSGIITTRDELLNWFRQHGRGSRRSLTATQAAVQPLATAGSSTPTNKPLVTEQGQGLLAAAMAAVAETSNADRGMNASKRASTPTAATRGA
jgi:hypothetical protein